MPNIKSAKKRVLVNEAKRQRNRAVTSEVKTAVKKFNTAIDSNNIEEAEKLLPLTMSSIDSACSKGVIHKNNAAHKKSAISARLSDIKSGKVTIEVKKDNKAIAAAKALAAREAREAAREETKRKATEKAEAKAAEGAEKAKKTKGKAEKPAKELKKEKDAPTESKPVKKTAKKAEPKSDAKEVKETKAKKTSKE